MNKTYWTLAVREDGRWAPHFGDYSNEVVEQERLDYMDSYDAKRKDTKVFGSGARQQDIDARIRELNA